MKSLGTVGCVRIKSYFKYGTYLILSLHLDICSTLHRFLPPLYSPCSPLFDSSFRFSLRQDFIQLDVN